jgi:hypothetical protein
MLSTKCWNTWLNTLNLTFTCTTFTHGEDISRMPHYEELGMSRRYKVNYIHWIIDINCTRWQIQVKINCRMFTSHVGGLGFHPQNCKKKLTWYKIVLKHLTIKENWPCKVKMHFPVSSYPSKGSRKRKNFHSTQNQISSRSCIVSCKCFTLQHTKQFKSLVKNYLPWLVSMDLIFLTLDFFQIIEIQ